MTFALRLYVGITIEALNMAHFGTCARVTQPKIRLYRAG